MKELFSSRMSAFESASKTSVAGSVDVGEEYRTFKDVIWSAVKSLQAQMELVHKHLEHLEMRSRSAVLLLHGIPETSNEVPTSTVSRICQDQLGIQDVSEGSLYSCYRLGKSRQGKKQRPLLIRFACQRTRDKVWASKKHLKGTGYTFSEFLTSARHAVFVEARRYFGVERSWTSDGRIVVLGQDGTRHRIASMDELRAILPDAATAKGKPTPDAAGPDRGATSNVSATPLVATGAAAVRREPSVAAATTLRTRTHRQKSPSRMRK